MPELGTKGWFVIAPGASPIYIPLLEGSRLDDPEALVPDLVGMGLADAATWLQGIKAPAMFINTRLYAGSGNWFTVARMQTILNQNQSTGMVGSTLGVVQWRHGADEVKQYPGARVAMIRFLVGQGGEPISCTMLVLATGSEAAETTNTGLPPTGRLAYMSQGVEYDGTLAEVLSLGLTFQLNLEADLTTPMTVDATTGVTLPNGYNSGAPPVVVLDVVQRKGATAPDGAVTALNNLTVKFRDPIKASANDVIFRLKALKPDKSKPFSIGQSRTMRSYRTVMPDSAGTPSYSVAAT